MNKLPPPPERRGKKFVFPSLPLVAPGWLLSPPSKRRNVTPVKIRLTTSKNSNIIKLVNLLRKKNANKLMQEQKNSLRPSGIDTIGDISWGTHFCQFYQAKQDLIDVLVPYFKNGLESREFCVWVTSEFLTKEEAIEVMSNAMPDFAKYLDSGQIEIFPYTEWYLKEGKFELQRVLQNWLKKYQQAMSLGYEGLRVSGNPFWINNKKDWDDFTEYESQIDSAIESKNILVLCTYSLEKCGAEEVIDVVINHQFALINRLNKWELIENAEHKKIRTFRFAQEPCFSVGKIRTFRFAQEPCFSVGKIEEALRISEKRLNRTEEIAHLGSWELDVKNNRLIWSDETYRIFGLKPGEFNATYQAFLEAVHPEDRLKVDKTYTDSLLTGKNGYEIQHRIIKQSTGETRFVREKCDHFKDKNGRVVKSVGMVQDITEEKLADEAKNNFIATMSHELRNPLTPILIGTELIQASLEKNLNAGIQASNHDLLDSLNIVRQQAKNMSRLLDDLLDITRISQGKVQLKIQRINLIDSIKTAINAAKPLIEKQRHNFSLQIPENPIWLQADPVRLEQVFVNLLNNAAKYTRRGGNIWLAVKKLQNINMAEISIRDTGIGIEAEKLNSIFDLFVRAASPFLYTQGELGIGLKLAKDIVSLHKGTIIAKSEGKNRGSEFVVRLPVLIEAPARLPLKGAGFDEQKSGKVNILVVDDDENVAKLIAKTLNYFGYAARSCFCGESAIAMAKKQKPQIAFIDIGLPGMNGYELAREMRKLDSGSVRKIKLVALTGYGQEKDKQLSKQSGFIFHLVKPVDMKTLRKTVWNLNR